MTDRNLASSPPRSLLLDVSTTWSPEQALAVVSFLDAIASAIWQLHGDAMNELIAEQGRRLVAEQVWTLRDAPPVEDDLPF